MSGGVVGITKTTTAVNRQALSFNLRTQIATDTKKIFGISVTETVDHDDAYDGNCQHDMEAEQKLHDAFVSCNVFGDDKQHTLQSIVTKDLATDVIQDSLLNAEQYGKEKLNTFVDERLVKNEVNFYDTLKQSKTLMKPKYTMSCY